ncbi:hypothetical protein ENUP19_0047G0194 [Entamoeba nuttalli]|uniref:RhoGAP domain containing protein n=2 Tax=Entamoeba nuttalli TaxID=412467 RepID=K2GVL9_ENTNP|nr:RhoGAP domain containing protein [Entamoeba nuttalli P19]EKE37877.1 RhoGAP domain containing protein [Entamoeba nuttalli P19]|eukprot:XP_008859761.1 RhoGAP domain containing protein [Entamoeba nuttalli P19]
MIFTFFLQFIISNNPLMSKTPQKEISSGESNGQNKSDDQIINQSLISEKCISSTNSENNTFSEPTQYNQKNELIKETVTEEKNKENVLNENEKVEFLHKVIPYTKRLKDKPKSHLVEEENVGQSIHQTKRATFSSVRLKEDKSLNSITPKDVLESINSEEQATPKPTTLTITPHESRDSRIKSTTTAWSNTNRNQLRKSMSLCTTQITSNTLEAMRSNVKMFDEMVIEVENTYQKISKARDRIFEIVKYQQQTIKCNDFIKNYSEILTSIQESTSHMLTNETGDLESLKEFTGYMSELYLVGFQQFKNQTQQLNRLMKEGKKLLEDSKTCIKSKNEFDKVYKEYQKINGKLKDEKDDKKQKIIQQTRDDIISKGIGEGRKALEVFDRNLQKYYEILQNSGRHIYETIQNGMNEVHSTMENYEDKIDSWKALDFHNEEFEEGEIKPWMKSPEIKRIITNEFMYVNTLTLLIDRYYIDICNSPIIVQCGISLQDMDIIFTDIIPLIHCHKNILMKLKESNPKEFLYCYSAYFGQLYQQYHNYLKHYQNSFIVLNKFMSTKRFKECVDNIDLIEGFEMKELITAPFNYITDFLENLDRVTTGDKEVINILKYVFEKLVKEKEIVKKQIIATSHLIKLNNFKGDINQEREYFGKVVISSGKLNGTMFFFSDYLIFAKSEKEGYNVIEMFETSNLENIRVIDRKTIEIGGGVENTTENSKNIQFIMKEETVKDFMDCLNKVQHKLTSYDIFGKEITTATIARNEQQWLFPKILHKIFDQCEKVAPEQEGVLRVSANVTQMEKDIKKINRKEEIDVSKLNVHEMINILKRYCNSIPNKLPSELQTIVLDESACEKIEKKLREMNNDGYLALIERLFRLLHLIEMKKEINLMGSDNLAKVISPNIYIDEGIVFDIEKLTRTVRFMIENYEEIFKKIRNEMIEHINKGNELSKQIEAIENQMNMTKYNEELSSSYLKDKKGISTKGITLKDVLMQSEVELYENKKNIKRWLVICKTELIFKKNMEDFESLIQLPLIGLTININEKTQLKNGSRSVTLVNFEDQPYFELLKKLIPS